MMNQDQFLLKWNNHQNNLVEVFSFLRTQDAFVDVTLACDGKSFPAHKVVLSACSPYFQTLFQSNPCKHPIVFLKDVKSHDMEALIEFIYKGEVSVSQAELASLISTAENLKIKGLAEPEKPSEKHSNCSNKRLASPPRLSSQQQLAQPTNNGPTLHGSPMYIQSTPSAKRKRIEAPHYATYSPAYLGAATANTNGSVVLRDKDLDGKTGTVVACSGPAGNSVVVDLNPAAAATHRLVEGVVNSTGAPGGVGSGPSQVVLVPVNPGEEHITADHLNYNNNSHHGALSTSDAVLYSVAGTAIYVGRVGAAPGEEATVSAREVIYTSGADHYASSDDGATVAAQPCGPEEKHEVKMSIKLEPSAGLAPDPWEPNSNSSSHSYDDVPPPASTSTPTPPSSSCITSPHPASVAHPSPLHMQHNHILPHSPQPPSPSHHLSGGEGGDLGSPPPSSSMGGGAGGEVPLSIPGLALHAEELSEHALHDAPAARAGGAGLCDEARCVDMTNFAAAAAAAAVAATQNSNSPSAGNAVASSSGLVNNGNNVGGGSVSNNSSNGNNNNSSATSEGTILEVQGCFIKSEVSGVSGGSMRRLLECEHCHKFFTSRFNLQRHQLIHTGAKPYECPLCQQRFNQSGHVKTHLRTRHPNHDQILQDAIHQSDQHSNSEQPQQQQQQCNSDQDEQKDDSSGSSMGAVSGQHTELVIQRSDHVITTHCIQRSEHL